jgi:hypothetical protein
MIRRTAPGCCCWHALVPLPIRRPYPSGSQASRLAIRGRGRIRIVFTDTCGLTSICRAHICYARLGRMSHRDPHGPPDCTPIKVGEVWENAVTGERATILERPWDNSTGRATAELAALVGARVVGEHRHPALVERLLEGELTVKRNGQTSILRQGRGGRHRARAYGMTGGMRPTMMRGCGWRSHPASGSCT